MLHKLFVAAFRSMYLSKRSTATWNIALDIHNSKWYCDTTAVLDFWALQETVNEFNAQCIVLPFFFVILVFSLLHAKNMVIDELSGVTLELSSFHEISSITSTHGTITVRSIISTAANTVVISATIS